MKIVKIQNFVPKTRRLLKFGGHFEKSALTALPSTGIFAGNLISIALWLSFPKTSGLQKSPGGCRVSVTGPWPIRCKLTALKASWVKRLDSYNFARWKLIPYFYSNNYGKDNLIFKMNFNSICRFPYMENSKISLFYKEKVESWHISNIVNYPPTITYHKSKMKLFGVIDIFQIIIKRCF